MWIMIRESDSFTHIHIYTQICITEIKLKFCKCSLGSTECGNERPENVEK